MSADPRGAALFDTAVGVCAVSWSPAGLTGLQLPHLDPQDTLRAVHVQRPDSAEGGTPPAAARHALESIRAVLDGKPDALSTIVLDLDGVGEFAQRVYAAARDVPPGTTTTYGELARRLAVPGAARAVGQALGRNPVPVVVPCHRVLAAGGKPGGFSAHGGTVTKQRLLAIERPVPTLFDDAPVEPAPRRTR